MSLSSTRRGFFCFGICLLVGCQSPNEADLTQINGDDGSSKPTIRIATDALFPPFHFVEGEDLKTADRDSGRGIDGSKVSGHDVELVRAVLEHAGLQHETVVVRPYDRLLNGISEGKYDVVAATTGITDARRKLYLFSDL